MVRCVKKNYNEGFTLIELVLTIGVSSMIAVLISSIFVTGIRLYRDMHDNIEIHQQEESIMDFIVSTVMSSSGIENIVSYERKSFYESDEKIELGVISLTNLDLKHGGKHTFTIQKDPKMEGRSIRYGKSNAATIEVGNYIKAIYTEPLPEGSSYSGAKGIKITIEMKKGKSNITVSKSMYFRKH